MYDYYYRLMDNYNIFEDNTLLNNIIPDLQPIVSEYIRNYQIFVIGKHNETYANYRIINENDTNCQSLMKTFFKYYRDNNGLLAIDSFNGSVLYGDALPFYVGDYLVRCTDEYVFNDSKFKKIENGNVVLFRISRKSCDEFKIKFIERIGKNNNYGDYYHCSTKIGLYVKSDIIFE